jgi:hypothetical protein
MSHSQFVYHLVPARVEGEFLMPLSQLKSALPTLYQQHATKYEGREDLMAKQLPHINVSWNDVLQLSPVHPEQMRDAMIKTGFGWRPMLFFEFDSSQIGMNQLNTVIYRHLPKQKGDFAFRAEDFEAFSPESLHRHADLPEATRAHYQESLATKTAPLLFIWVPHVLFHGRISVVNAKIIEIA